MACSWIGKLSSITMSVFPDFIIDIIQFQTKAQQKFLWKLKADSKIYVEVQWAKCSQNTLEETQYGILKVLLILTHN